MNITRTQAQTQAVSALGSPSPAQGAAVVESSRQLSPLDVAAARDVGAAAPAVINRVDPAVAAQASEGARRQRDGAAIAPADSDTEGARSDELSREEAAEVRELKARDAEVRAHEQAHAAAGGGHTGAPVYETKVGPDGRTYAVGGEVSVDVSVVNGDPEATLQKMRQVKRAALAPASPSSADRAVAAKASAQAAAAARQIAQERTEPADDATTATSEAAATAQNTDSARSDGAESLGQWRTAKNAYAPPAPAAVGSMVNLQSCGKCGGSHMMS